MANSSWTTVVDAFALKRAHQKQASFSKRLSSRHLTGIYVYVYMVYGVWCVYMYMYMYIYLYICVCVCVCVCGINGQGI